MPYKKQTSTDKIKAMKVAAAKRSARAANSKKDNAKKEVDRIVSERTKSIKDDAVNRRRTTRNLFLKEKQKRLRKEAENLSKPTPGRRLKNMIDNVSSGLGVSLNQNPTKKQIKNRNKVKKLIGSVKKGAKKAVKSSPIGVGVRAVRKKISSTKKKK